MAKHEEFLKQVKERAEGSMDILKEPPVSAETARLQMVIRSGRPDDVLKLLAIIEKLREQRNYAYENIRGGWIEFDLIAADKELDEIVGAG